MTGIFPIKKDGSESAVSDFREFTILQPSPFVRYTGFTEIEVKCLYEQYHISFEQIKQKRYPTILEGYIVKMVLVGINYNEKSKKNSCKIEKINL